MVTKQVENNTRMGFAYAQSSVETTASRTYTVTAFITKWTYYLILLPLWYVVVAITMLIAWGIVFAVIYVIIILPLAGFLLRK